MSNVYIAIVFFFKQKTAYEMRISDWSSDVCSSDLDPLGDQGRADGSDALDRRPGRMEGRTRGKVGGRNVHRKLPETGWHHRARGWHSGLLHRDAGVGGVTEDRMMADRKSVV